MTRLLVFGGTRFFGKKTVEHFIQHGYEVTIATRGLSQDDFGKTVKRIILDREDGNHPGWQLIAKTDWDLVFDNICYSWESAKLALDNLKQVGHYLVTSSLAVYEGTAAEGGFTENQFKPKSYDYSESQEVSYSEGKRQVEAYFAKSAPFPVTYLRFPVVLDNDDYTERLHFYIRKTLAGQPLIFKRESGHFSFVQASEIPLAIQFIIDQQIEGPLNVSSTPAFSTSELIASLQVATKKDPLVVIDSEQARSPFSHYDQALDVARLASFGYPVTTLASWLPGVMNRITQEAEASDF